MVVALFPYLSVFYVEERVQRLSIEDKSSKPISKCHRCNTPGHRRRDCVKKCSRCGLCCKTNKACDEFLAAQERVDKMKKQAEIREAKESYLALTANFQKVNSKKSSESLKKSKFTIVSNLSAQPVPTYESDPRLGFITEKRMKQIRRQIYNERWAYVGHDRVDTWNSTDLENWQVLNTNDTAFKEFILADFKDNDFVELITKADQAILNDELKVVKSLPAPTTEN